MQPQHLLTSEEMFPNKADVGLCEKQRFIYLFTMLHAYITFSYIY